VKKSKKQHKDYELLLRWPHQREWENWGV